jgi:hypothetical protein
MTPDQARTWIIRTSLILTTSVFAFVVIAPTVCYPLDPSSNHIIRLLQIITPVFVGYLGSASHFVFSDSAPAANQQQLSPNAVMLIKGPVLAWIVMSTLAFTAYGLSNRASAAPGSGWSFDFLSGLITITLSLLTATTNLAVTYLFKAEKKS